MEVEDLNKKFRDLRNPKKKELVEDYKHISFKNNCFLLSSKGFGHFNDIYRNWTFQDYWDGMQFLISQRRASDGG